MGEPPTEKELNEVFPEILNHHRVVVDEGTYGPENAQVKWFLSLVEPNDMRLESVARVEGIDVRSSGHSSEVVLLTEDAWRKIGELKGWIK